MIFKKRFLIYLIIIFIVTSNLSVLYTIYLYKAIDEAYISCDLFDGLDVGNFNSRVSKGSCGLDLGNFYKGLFFSLIFFLIIYYMFKFLHGFFNLFFLKKIITIFTIFFILIYWIFLISLPENISITGELYKVETPDGDFIKYYFEKKVLKKKFPRNRGLYNKLNKMEEPVYISDPNVYSDTMEIFINKSEDTESVNIHIDD